MPDRDSPVDNTARLIGGEIGRVRGHCQVVAAYPETPLLSSHKSPAPAEGRK